MPYSDNISLSAINGYLSGMTAGEAVPMIGALAGLGGAEAARRVDESHVIEVEGWLITASAELVNRAISWSRG